MSCIEVNLTFDVPAKPKVTRVDSGLSAIVHKIGEDHRDKLSVLCLREESLVPQISRIGGEADLKCSIVCTLEEVMPYLEVSPQEIQWITDDAGVFFDVESNVEWIIVTS